MIATAEWNFFRIPAEDEPAACGYEYAREMEFLSRSKPWLSLTPQQRTQVGKSWRAVAEGRGHSPRSLYSVEPDEAVNWWSLGAAAAHDARKVVAFVISLRSHSDTEIVAAFSQELSKLRKIHAAVEPQRKGKRAVVFRAHLENLGWMRLRHALPINELISVATQHPAKCWANGSTRTEILRSIDDHRLRAKRYFEQQWPAAPEPMSWKPFSQRVDIPRAKST